MRVYGFGALGYAGRLGNQLWQVAAVISASAKDLGSRPHVPGDWEYRRYLSLPEDFYEAPQRGDEVIDLARDPRGPYFQRLEDIEGADCKTLFAPPEQSFAQHRTALHVRRTDYLNKPDRFPQVGEHYYQTALKQARAKHQTQAWVFSDDIDWCEENSEALGLREEDVFIRGHVRPIDPRARTGEPTDILDLFKMSTCDAFVIANSTFSWWAAYLSSSDEVYYPDRWFGPDVERFTGFLPTWTEVPC